MADVNLELRWWGGWQCLFPLFSGDKPPGRGCCTFVISLRYCDWQTLFSQWMRLLDWFIFLNQSHWNVYTTTINRWNIWAAGARMHQSSMQSTSIWQNNRGHVTRALLIGPELCVHSAIFRKSKLINCVLLLFQYKAQQRNLVLIIAGCVAACMATTA